MTTRPRPSGRPRLRLMLGVGTVAIVGTMLLAGFHTQLSELRPDDRSDEASELVTPAIVGIRTFLPAGDVQIDEDVEYATELDGTPLTLDVCSPAEATPTATATASAGAEAAAAQTESATPAATDSADAADDADADADDSASAELRPAVLSIHGGSWARGDKANSDWRTVCEWLASEGFVAYSVNYRLVPDVVFPAALDDLTAAVSWIRDDDNAEKYGIDPDRIGAFGGSAGANLAAVLGATGSGPLTDGARVAAIAALSGPVDLTYDGLVSIGASDSLQQIAREYVGCDSLQDCDAATEASVADALDRTDPPVFIATSEQEYVPLVQSTDYADALADLDIDHELVTVPGTLHSIGILDEAMRARVATFLHRYLGI
ncbi:alpha/beta hydrolase [Cryobacterium frigoriphilum]|uniref:Alpha/beta hydrolase n=1 Tax=Cryobacterium frigoriphilum TaxID=1259150 RepID=A0A4R9ABH2_9MICO|nr:alpha/beta hydrolase [Cryobacterium frigoriphilum]TFD55549.1 alpha/beta hydrolase [Cryobacterium frigoriphilum]